ncbi:hypothetical protein V8E54_015161 [Elaphomyces granulatus]
MPTLLLVTKYGLRLHVSHDATIHISYIELHDDVDGCNSKLSTSNAVTPTPDSISYWLSPSWLSSFLWNRASLDDPEVYKDVIEARYPRLAKFYFEWVDIYDDAFQRQECNLGSDSWVFPKMEDYLAWKTEGLLLACWLVLQDHVQEVEFESYYLRKGHLEEELQRFLVHMVKYIDKEYYSD